jgi:hypothetical protein
MSDPVARTARRTATELASAAPGLRSEVEAVLQSRGTGSATQFLDPISLAAVIISAAQLAWTIHTDRKGRASQEDIARELRKEVTFPGDVAETTRDQIVDVVARETIGASDNL